MPNSHASPHLLHYQWQGAYVPGRPCMVFLHDGLGAIGAWRDVPARLGRALSANSLLYDRWGYGGSAPRPDFPFRFMEAEVPALRALLAELHIARPVLIGHSDGGSIALLHAALHPGEVRAVVTEAAHTFVEAETRAGIQALLDAQHAGAPPAWLERLHGRDGPKGAAALLQAWAGGWLSEAHRRWDIRDRLHLIRCPVLAIQGATDEFGSEAQVDSILAAVHSAQRYIVPDCGHTPHNQAPDDFCGRVTDFLRPLLLEGR